MYRFLVGIEKCYEVVELTYKFQGATGRAMYQFCLLMLMYIGLLAYVQVFVKSVVGYFDSLSLSESWLITGAMTIIVVPLSCCELTEQVVVCSLL